MLFDLMLKLSDFLWGTVLFYSLVPIGVYFTITFGFAQIIHFIKMWRFTFAEAFDNKEGVNGFMALMISTASRVGTGNLAGVAVALTAGGPGAIFWMWIVAIVGMATSIAENTLAQLYKDKDPDKKGFFIGGPAAYMTKGMGGKLGRFFAVSFAIATILCYGTAMSAVQANTIKDVITLPFSGVHPVFIAIGVSILTALIAFGGVKKLGSYMQVVVPFMAFLYLGLVFYASIVSYDKIPWAFLLIVKSAFGVKPVVGGTVGYAINVAITNGVRRGLFSNEAGLGTSPNVAAVADVKHPVTQGFVQAWGVFLDTILICSATAFLILISGVYKMDGQRMGIQLVQDAMAVYYGDSAKILMIIVAFFFAFSTIIGNYYYGEVNTNYLSNNSKTALNVYRLAQISFIFLGCLSSLAIWDLGDFFLAIMAIINLVAVLYLSPKVIAAVKDFNKKIKTQKEPTFKASDLPGVENIDVWK